MHTKLKKISLAIASLASAAGIQAQTNYNFTNTTANTFTNGYVLSGTLSTNSSNAVTAANLSVSNGGTPITFTGMPSESGTYTRTLCGTSTTFQEYRFGTGSANTLYLDVMSSQTDAALAGQLSGVHTSLLLSSGSYALNQACGGIEEAARTSRHPKMTLNAASLVNANSGIFTISGSSNTAVPRLLNTISSNLLQFNNRFGLGAIQKRLEQAKAAKAAAKAAKAEKAASYAKAKKRIDDFIARQKKDNPDYVMPAGVAEGYIASLMTIDWLGGFKYEAQHGLTRHETPRAGS